MIEPMKWKQWNLCGHPAEYLAGTAHFGKQRLGSVMDCQQQQLMPVFSSKLDVWK